MRDPGAHGHHRLQRRLAVIIEAARLAQLLVLAVQPAEPRDDARAMLTITPTIITASAVPSDSVDAWTCEPM